MSTPPSRPEKAISFNEKFALFSEHWTPKVIAQMNDYQFKLVKVQGEFLWHSHADTDEVFIVLEGELQIHFREGCVTLGAGEMYVVGKGVEHKPSANEEAKVLLVEPCGVINTGEHTSALTAENDAWI
ncbi:cupin domain-containing protein [Pseudomonas syringae]|uniref:cupin domain-containing protein n=1 Tax=Pseudomonas syringae TaxID=317 RepID=UPI001F21CCEB|nr:cupin domain-containing protein [Pseudomonas syringae]